MAQVKSSLLDELKTRESFAKEREFLLKLYSQIWLEGFSSGYDRAKFEIEKNSIESNLFGEWE